MTGRKPITKLFIAAALGVTALLATTGSALAGVADYTNTSSFSVPNNTGQAGIPQPVTVPAGRTAVESIELSNVMPSYGGGGGGDLSLRLTGPNGTSVDVIGAGCNIYPNTSAFTISDSATFAISDPAFCTALQANPTTTAGRPAQPLSAFNGIASAGTWALTVIDAGANNVTNGSFKGWTLHLTHANPTLNADPAPFKIKKQFALSAICDANCTVTTGGAAGATTTKLAANSATTIIAPASKKAQKKGKGVVTLTATDETGGTATTSVNAKTLKTKKKKK
jgi:subtilisin-like proprotein convertase family protein